MDAWGVEWGRVERGRREVDGRRGKAGGGEKKGHKNCCFSPLTAASGGFFSSLMKFIPSPGFPGLKKPELETGTKISLFYNNNPGIPVVPVFLNDF